MSISQKIELNYKNQTENIKKEKNKEVKMRAIGNLIMDLGKNSISAVAKACNCCWRYAKKSFHFTLGLIPKNKVETRGRTPLTKKYPELEADINEIIKVQVSTDPKFKNEKKYVRLTINEIKQKLIETKKYEENSFSNSGLNNVINNMGLCLKKVKKNKPLKKIKETDEIFENVHNKKSEAEKDSSVALISIDTKDKVLIGPYSRGGKNRIQIEAVDHELTNDCIIPFGILDLKRNKPHFFNFVAKPTSLDLVDCIEEFYREQYHNSDIKKIAILLDNGPDNSGVRRAFLKGLVDICIKYNIQIELIYYPPYHSKYNPVERLWARLENVWNGFLLETEEICLQFMKNLTWKGVKSVTKLKEVKYEKGITLSNREMKELEKNHIKRTTGLEKWSILITP